jgi:molybdate transport system substrate-binding protein
VVQVFASTSLTDVLPKLVQEFQADQSGLDLRLTYSPDTDSARLAAAATGAAVLLTEGPVNGSGLHIADNRIVIAVRTGNPKGIADLTALARSDVRVALCRPEEPCGAASAAILSAAGVSPAMPTKVGDVRTALTQVEAGNTDAALVYRTDTRAAGDTAVDTIEFGLSSSAVAHYQASAIPDRPNVEAAQAFVTFLGSGPARGILGAAGFQEPTP